MGWSLGLKAGTLQSPWLEAGASSRLAGLVLIIVASEMSSVGTSKTTRVKGRAWMGGQGLGGSDSFLSNNHFNVVIKRIPPATLKKRWETWNRDNRRERGPWEKRKPITWKEGFITFKQLKWVKVAQLCLTLYNTMDRSLPGSSVHGILQAGILEGVAMPSSRESSWPWDRICIAGRTFTVWATRETSNSWRSVLS